MSLVVFCADDKDHFTWSTETGHVPDVQDHQGEGSEYDKETAGYAVKCFCLTFWLDV